MSSRYGLTGKPDYLVEAANGLIPVELKSRDCRRSGPHASEAAQLTAYCVLVEDSFGATPSHGIIQYADRSWPIRYTVKGRDRLLQILDEMREARQFGPSTAIISTRLVVAPAAIEPSATRHSTERPGWTTPPMTLVARHFVKALLNRAELLAINPTQLPRAGLLASFGLGKIYESGVPRQLDRHCPTSGWCVIRQDWGIVAAQKDVSIYRNVTSASFGKLLARRFFPSVLLSATFNFPFVSSCCRASPMCFRR